MLDPPQMFVFTRTQLVNCLNIEIFNDSIIEPTEFFNVHTSSFDLQVVSNVNSATVFIADNDG